ncbi:MAG: YlxR family protein [Acholeplasmataceae bacterium]
MSKVKKIPLRTCVVTKTVYPKTELIRVTATKDGVVSVDKTGKAHGRGAYLKLEKSIILQAQKTKVLDKKLEAEVPENVYLELLGLVDA